MPLLRIVGQPTKATRAIIRQLRNLGFEIDACSTGAQVPPDMEPETESVSLPQDARLAGAFEWAENNDATILVCPEIVGPAAQNSAISQASTADVSDWPIWQAETEAADTPDLPRCSRRSSDPSKYFPALRTVYQRVVKAADPTILGNGPVFTRFVGAVAVVLVLLLLFHATGHRIAPLSERILEGSSAASQPVPFHAMDNKLTTAANSVSSTAKPLGIQSLKVSDRSERSLVAKNTVIRYTEKAHSPAGDVREPGIKYYSDLKSN